MGVTWENTPSGIKGILLAPFSGAPGSTCGPYAVAEIRIMVKSKLANTCTSE